MSEIPSPAPYETKIGNKTYLLYVSSEGRGNSYIFIENSIKPDSVWTPTPLPQGYDVQIQHNNRPRLIKKS